MKKYILITLLALMAIPALAQHDEQVTVEGKYRPKVNKVNKLKLTPETPQPSYDLPSTEVNPMEAKQKFALDLEKIAPTAFAAKDDKLVTPTQNFIMAGVGTRLSPMFLYKHNSMLTKTLGLGMGIKHNSSWLNMKNYAPSSYMNNAFDVGLSFEDLGQYRLETGAFFNNDMYHYYGVNLTEIPLTDTQIEEVCPRQVYNTIGAFVKLAPKGYPLGVPVGPGAIRYHYTFDRFGCGDGLVELDYSYVYIPLGWFKKGESPKKLKVDVDVDFNHYKCNDSLINRGFGRINPSFEMSGDFYRIHIGASVDGYVAKKDSKVAVRPDVSGSLFVLNKKLEFYAGVNGGLSMLTFSDFIEENPFVWQLQDFRVKNVKLGFEGGVRTNIAEIVDLHLGVRYRHTDNDPFYELRDEFIDNSAINNKFDLVYDETKTVNVLADMRVKLRNSLTADLSFAYNSCKPTNEEYAWYRPTTEGRLKLTYDLNDKLAFHSSFLYQGGRYAKVWNDSPYGKYPPRYDTQKLKDVLDLSLGADYKVNDQITAFALIDNVLCQKYQLYFNYPVTNIQFFAGVKLRF